MLNPLAGMGGRGRGGEERPVSVAWNSLRPFTPRPTRPRPRNSAVVGLESLLQLSRPEPPCGQTGKLESESEIVLHDLDASLSRREFIRRIGAGRQAGESRRQLKGLRGRLAFGYDLVEETGLDGSVWVVDL